MSKAIEYIDEQAVINLTKRLIKSESLSGNERKLATLLAIEMKKAHFNLVQFDEVSHNIIGVLQGAGKGKTLVLVGHIDVIPPGLMLNPFDPQEIDGTKLGSRGKVITGRGSCDMKASLAAMISAAGAMKRARSRLKGNFVVIGLANTKTGKSSGITKLLKRFDIKPDFVVYCGPTNFEINTAHPGQVTFEIITKGKMSNIGNVKEGDNAIYKMNKIITCLIENTTLPEDKRFGKANMIVSSISSLPIDECYAIPSLCKSLLVRQYFKGENPENIRNELLELLKKNGYKDQEVEITIKNHFAPMEIDPDQEIIKIIQATKDFVMKKEAKISQWNSGISISNLLDIDMPVVGFGPGDEKYAHTSIEHIPVEHIRAAIKFFTVLGEKICVQMKEKTEA